MSDTNSTTPAIELLLVLSVQIKLVRAVPDTPIGNRMIFDALSGSFDGPRLSGQIAPTGGDWVTRTATGSQMNVRLLLETRDGVSILFQYAGKACQDGDLPRIDVAGTFDAPTGPYNWLNDVQTFGRGAFDGETVRYHFYRFK